MVFKALRIFRLIRFGVMSSILFISLFYSPSDAWTIIINLINLTIMNLDVLFHISKDKIVSYLDWVMKKANDVKPDIEPIKETLKFERKPERPWYKPSILYKDKDSSHSWWKNDSNKPTFSLRQTYINYIGQLRSRMMILFLRKMLSSVGNGVLFVSVLVIGGIVYYVYFEGQNPFSPKDDKAPGDIPSLNLQ